MPPDTRPEQGSKNPETGLFCWRYNGTFKWVSLEEFSRLQSTRSACTKRYRSKKRAVKKSKVAYARSPVTQSLEKNILALHAKGKSLFYISSIYSMKISKIKEVLEKANP